MQLPNPKYTQVTVLGVFASQRLHYINVQVAGSLEQWSRGYVENSLNNKVQTAKEILMGDEQSTINIHTAAVNHDRVKHHGF